MPLILGFVDDYEMQQRQQRENSFLNYKRIIFFFLTMYLHTDILAAAICFAKLPRNLQETKQPASLL